MKASGILIPTNSWEHEANVMESWITGVGRAGHELQILEAGCGQKWPLKLGDIKYTLTGVDLDGAALALRLEKAKDLHKAVEGDLRTVSFAPSSFDVIYNSFVLEHIPGAERVMQNFVKWLKPGGLAVIHIPDPSSVWGFMSRVTPQWFHVFFYRYVKGHVNAGKPGYAPYPVAYDKVVSRAGMSNFCEKNGMAVVAEYATGGYHRPGRGIVGVLFVVAKHLIAALSLGTLSASHDNLLFILKKR